MNKILASVASIAAICLAATPSLAAPHNPGGSGGSPAPAPAPAPSMGGGGGTAPTAPVAMTPGGGTGPGANNSNYGGVINTAPQGTNFPGGGIGGTVGYSPAVLAQAQSYQQRLSQLRQPAPEAPIETIPVAPDVAVPPNTKKIRGRG